MMRRTTYGLVAAVAVALLLGIAYCNRGPSDRRDATSQGDSAGPNTTTAHTDSVEGESEPLNGPEPADLHGGAAEELIVSRPTPALSKPLDSMTNAEVYAYLITMKYKTGAFNTHSAKVPCTQGTPPKPCASGDSADLLIQPEAGMNLWEHDSIPKNGLVVARIINSAPLNHDAAVFGYPARRKTWWVVDSSGGTLRSRFFIRTYSSSGAAVQYVTSTPHPFIHCPHPPAPPGTAARAKFWTCVVSADSAVALRGDRDATPVRAATLESYIHPVSLRSAVPLPLVPKPAPMLLESNWVSCGGGCCATN